MQSTIGPERAAIAVFVRVCSHLCPLAAVVNAGRRPHHNGRYVCVHDPSPWLACFQFVDQIFESEICTDSAAAPLRGSNSYQPPRPAAGLPCCRPQMGACVSTSGAATASSGHQPDIKSVGDLRRLALAISRQPALVHTPNSRGQTPLHLAACNGRQPLSHPPAAAGGGPY
jgi:hypothetical protein